MGADFQTYKVRAKTKTDLKAKYNELVDEAVYEYGHSGYSGTIKEGSGLKILSIELPKSEAEDYINNHAKKWEETLAVKIKDTEDDWLLGGVYSC